MGLKSDTDVGTVSLNGVTFAVNLLWNMVETQKEFKPILKTEAEQLGTNIYCKFLLTDGEVCYGLADESIGHKPGMPVLPAIIASMFETSLIGVWHLQDDDWYILAVDSLGVISIDKIVKGEDEVFDNFSSLLRSMKWQSVFCPDMWDIPERSDIFLLEDIGRNKKKIIQSIKYRPQRKHILIAALVVSIVIIAVVFFFRPQRTEYIAPKMDSAVKEHNVFPASSGLLSKNFILSCKKELFSKDVYASSIDGYSQAPVVRCTNNSVIFSLKKQFGSSDYISEKVRDDIHRAGGELRFPAKDVAELIFPLTGGAVGDVKKMTTLSAQQDMMQTEFDNTFLNIEFSDNYDCGNASTQEIIYDREFTCVDFNVKFEYDPEILIPIFSARDSTVINDITYDYSDSLWILSGTSYALK